jgi:septal ring factor EnvC (AmiA/AmiB activator)
VEEPSIDTFFEKEIIQTEQQGTTDELSKIQQKLLEAEDKNKQLEKSLSQSEEKIRQLEKEISSLKNQKQSKNIKDYFGKK